VSKANNPLYGGIDLKKLPLETLYGTMRLLRQLHPGGLKEQTGGDEPSRLPPVRFHLLLRDPGPDLPLWQTRTWREVQRRSKLPDTDCEKGENP